MSDSYHLLPINHRLKFSNESKKSASDNPDMYREYGQIEPGMTINNAKEILKDYSVEKKTGSDGRVFYIWKVPKGKYFIVVRSLDDKVKSKSIKYY